MQKACKLVYIIEDDSIAAAIAESVLGKSKICEQMQVYANGQEAFDQLRSALATGDPLPDLILLDLNMPLMDGWDFLVAFADLRIDHQVAVFVLTSSIRPADIEKASTFKEVRGYFPKPLDDGKVAQMKQLFETKE